MQDRKEMAPDQKILMIEEEGRRRGGGGVMRRRRTRNVIFQVLVETTFCSALTAA